MKYLKLLILALLPPMLLQAQSYSLKRSAFVTAGGRIASGRYTAAAAAGIPTLSGMESASFSVGPLTAVALAAEQLPQELALLQNYPNPFNAQTCVEVTAARPEQVEVMVYNLLGEPVAALHRGLLQAGSHKLVWTGIDGASRQAPSGIYVIKMTAPGFAASRKVLLLR